MNISRPVIPHPLEAEAKADAERIQALWRECRTRFGSGGRFLYGAFGAADAMYAPVVSRFHTYAVEVDDFSRDYMRAVMALPAWSEWRGAAVREPWILPHDEVDWPQVKRES
jgi:glutathione S-transferase